MDGESVFHMRMLHVLRPTSVQWMCKGLCWVGDAAVVMAGAAPF